MLKSYLIFSCLFMSFSTISLAQQYKLDSVVQTIKDSQFITSQKYDVNNKKIEVTRYESKNTTDSIKNIERVQLQFDKNKNEILSSSAFWNTESKAWNENEKIEKEYNADNKLIRTVNLRKKDNKWIKDSENVITYTKDSIIEIYYELRDGEFNPTHKDISSINSFGKITTHEIFIWNNKNQNWQQLIRTENQYKNDTILIGFETLKWEESKWLKQEKVIYDLDKNGNKTNTYTTYKGNSTNWIPTYKFEQISISKKQKQISQTSKWSEKDNKWIISSQIETYLNSEGKKQDVIFLSSDTSTHQLKIISEQLHLYDQRGRLKLFQEINHSEQKITGTQNTIKFDKTGNVIQENFFELNIDGNTWKDKMTTEFSYYKDIELNSTSDICKNIDLFELNKYNYKTNKNAIRKVKVYKYQNDKKVLHEEFEYFYSISK